MRSVMSLIAAGAASLFSTLAFAADMPIMPPPVYAPPPAADFGGWYLRGDIGFSNQKVKDVHYSRESAYTPMTSFNQTSAFDTAGIYGVGVGYRFNSWFRADVTGQYRGNANFKATDRFNATAGGVPYSGIDNYSGSKSEWLVLANAYVDLGTWWCVTPFIGAGVGGARVTISNFTDTGINNLPFTTTSFATAPTSSKWNFAWAAHAGLAYNVNPNLVLELAYSYVDLGQGQTGVLSDYVGNTTGNVFKFKDITSHDLKLGVRWNFDQPPPPPMPALIRKG
ncbi:outer membrane protein [Bradyrhizobium sp. SZCCHNS3052]|uniref:outer membrane protein n=1 Tax=Bradyrhizobium sp. SZCCHNS3052 TaxID=3057321 RepID=UPI00291603DD|nr:outer membrane beta-barrel protein [Bradyrhizobium sp. SZCCHNS3052]